MPLEDLVSVVNKGGAVFAFDAVRHTETLLRIQIFVSLSSAGLSFRDVSF